MISELRFAKSYNSVWRSLAPTMELFVRKVNLRLYERDWPEMASASAASLRALINRVAFEALVTASQNAVPLHQVLEAIRDNDHLEQAELKLVGVRTLGKAELKEVKELAERMARRLLDVGQERVTLGPRFEGCGLINACFGDAQTSSGGIWELKDGDRPFRSYEFRQVSTYAALFFNSTGRPPPFVGVINSRRGVSVKMPLNALADEVAGQSGIDYLREIVRAISDPTLPS